MSVSTFFKEYAMFPQNDSGVNIFLELLTHCSFDNIEPAVFSSGLFASKPSFVTEDDFGLFHLDIKNHPLDSIPEGYESGENADLLRFSLLCPSIQLFTPVIVLPYLLMIRPDSLCLILRGEDERRILGVVELRYIPPKTKILGFLK